MKNLKESTTYVEFHFEPNLCKGYEPVRFCFKGGIFDVSVEQQRDKNIKLVGTPIPRKGIIYQGYEALLQADILMDLTIPKKDEFLAIDNFVIPNYCVVSFRDWRDRNIEDFSEIDRYMAQYNNAA